MFKLTLSASKAQPKTKTEGLTVTEFTKKEFDVTPDSDLKELFTTRLYSTNYWQDGKCGKRNYLGMYGMTMDVDKDFPMDQAKEMFKEFNYIIHTSTSHKADIPEKGGIQDRYRIILPADPKDYNNYADAKTAQALYAVIIKKYPFVDAACAELARKYFPFLNAQYPQLFELHINETGKYFAVSELEVLQMEKVLAAVRAPRKTGAMDKANMVAEGEKFITWDMELVLGSDKSTKVKVREFTEKTSVFCPFCNDINSAGHSAYICFNTEGYPILICDHCKNESNATLFKYYLPLNEKFKHIFYLENNMMWVRKAGSVISIGKMPEAHLNHLTAEESRKLKNWLTRHRAMSASTFKMQYVVDGYAEDSYWGWVDNGNTMQITAAPIAVNIKDNAYINKWLEDTFEEYAEFFKDYLALYCYYNHEAMPVIVLTGRRGSGKTTIAEFIASFFQGSHSDWSGNEDQFNGYLEKRLLIVDEANVDKKEQYTKIKAMCGRGDLNINKKHMAPYQIVNNVCIIMLTNEQTPMYLINAEKPPDAQNNQFFMLNLVRKSMLINAKIKDELRDRAGHYIRTELRQRFENWQAQNIGATCRYGLPVPITELLDQQYEDARTSLDYECDTIFLACLNGVALKDRLGNLMEVLGPYDTVNTEDLRRLITGTKVSNTNVKSFRERMQAHGYLKKTKTRKGGLDAWEVIKTASVGHTLQQQIKGT